MKITHKIKYQENHSLRESERLAEYQQSRPKLKKHRKFHSPLGNEIFVQPDDAPRSSPEHIYAETFLGSRQIDLLKLKKRPTSHGKQRKMAGRRGRVKKVLKGRRKITSAELRGNSFKYFA